MFDKLLRFLRGDQKTSVDKKGTRSGLRCPACHEWMREGSDIKRWRRSHQLDHYMCQCGAVSHWLFTLVMVCVGYGRYRSVTVSDRGVTIGDFKPNRITEDDLLWLCPLTSTAYFFKRDMLVRYPLSNLPRSRTGEYRFTPLERNWRIKVDGVDYEYMGFSFQKVHARRTENT